MRIRVLLSALALGGCTVGPNYAPPHVGIPATFGEPSGSVVAGGPDLARWWQGFGDPELDRLIAAALSDNLDVLTAASRIREARAELRGARAQGLPTLDAAADVNHVHFSKNAGLSSLSSIFAGGGAAGGGGGGRQNGIAAPGDGITTYAVGFDASWELDIFGGARRNVEGATARVDAAVWNGRDAAVSLIAEVADDYLQLRLLQQREAIARAEVARQTRSLQIMVENFKVGLVPEGDSIRQRAQLAAAQAALPALIAEQRAQMHAIAALLAKPPEELVTELTRPSETLAAPAIPPGLPSELLRRRPDIRAAEPDLAAATADIGVAVAQLYPRISLTGMPQLISTALGNLFTGDSLQATGTAALDFPILDFGRRRAQIVARREAAQQAYLAYQRTVLGALRDVEDALARVSNERQREAAFAAGTKDAERTVAAVNAQYATGLVGLNNVLDAEASVLSDRDQLAQSRGQLRRDLVSLYKALGGGWEGADGQPDLLSGPLTSSAPSSSSPFPAPSR